MMRRRNAKSGRDLPTGNVFARAGIPVWMERGGPLAALLTPPGQRPDCGPPGDRDESDQEDLDEPE